ncbi:MAG: hypothetical protein LBC74_06540 [Planctomycetaceae bacterium]|nr:hypothetical protein [Planctomycetaceae bacterium]
MPDSMKVDLGFVFAMPMEAAGLVDLLAESVTTKGNGRVFHRGRLKKASVVIVESGIGQEKAASATKALLDIFCPSFIVSAGYGGGLLPELNRFSVHQPYLLLRKSDGKIIDIVNNIPQIRKEITDENQQVTNETDTVHNIVTKNCSMLVTVDQPVMTASEKLLLGKESGAGLVDMETFAVAEVCNNLRNGDDSNGIIRFSAVRIILDTVEEELPKEVKRILQSYDFSTARLIGTTISSLFKRPSVIFDLYSLKERALQATDILAKYIVANIASGKYI